MPSSFLSLCKKEIKDTANSGQAKKAVRFFKTGPGDYGEGDKFLGLNMSQQKRIAYKFENLNFLQIKELLYSEFHEHRMVALLILIQKFEKGDKDTKQKIFNFYIKHSKQVNNWDLVDTSAHKIAGIYLLKKNKDVLYRMAKSTNLWQRRIAIVSTVAFIKEGEFNPTLKVAKMLLKDGHDLIHKAVGWMLREVGKKDLAVEEKFLKKYHKSMPRTMLRYAIERFPEEKRQTYIRGRV